MKTGWTLGLALTGVLLGNLIAAPQLTKEEISAGISKLIEELNRKVGDEQRGFSHASSSVTSNFATLEAAIASGEFQAAEATLTRLPLAGVMNGEQLAKAREFTGAIQEYIARSKLNKTKERDKEVSAFANEVHEKALKAKSAAELEPLLVRSVSLVAPRNHQHDAFSQRIDEKLTGAVFALQKTMRHLDYKQAGNIDQANQEIQNLARQTQGVPVFTAEEIEKLRVHRTIANSGSYRHRVSFKDIFEGVTTTESIPGVIAELEKTHEDSEDISQVRNTIASLTKIAEAKGFLEAGDHLAASELVKDGRFRSGDSKPYIDRILSSFLLELMEPKIAEYTVLRPEPEEKADQFLIRAIDEAAQEGKLEGVRRLINLFGDYFDHQSKPPWMNSDAAAVSYYLAAKRLEEAGDDYAALKNYRIIIGLTDGKYAPMEEANAGIAALKEKNPELFTDLNSALLNEIEGLRNAVNRVSTMRSRYPQRP